MKKNLMKATMAIGLLAITLTLSACNTIEGIGEDAKAAGNAIEHAASSNKKY